MIKVENLKKVYETKVKKGLFKRERVYLEAIKNLSMDLEKGNIVGLLGINGAGKTTTIKMMSTLLLPTSGEITVDGIDAIKKPMEVKKKINMVAGGERMIYWRLTGRENLWYYGQIYGIEDSVLNSRIEELLSLVGIKEKGDIPVENYSKGMKQRLQIARGLINNPDYIFMDEPTLGLDAVIAKELRGHIKRISKEEGKGILLTSHYMEEIEELCDYVYILNRGEIIAKGTPKELSRIGLKNKTLWMKVYKSDEELYKKISHICIKNDRDASVEYHKEENAFAITSTTDLSLTLSKFLVENEVGIHSFYEKEPKLEDAIIRLSKEA